MLIIKAFLFNEIFRFETSSLNEKKKNDKYFDLEGERIKLHFKVHTPLIVQGLKSMQAFRET
jgi:hypothetical protein